MRSYGLLLRLLLKLKNSCVQLEKLSHTRATSIRILLDTADQLAKAGTMKLLFSFDTSFYPILNIFFHGQLLRLTYQLTNSLNNFVRQNPLTQSTTPLVNKNSNI